MSGDLAPDVPAAWDGLLDQGEQIVWQGKPDRGFAISPKQSISVLFGLVFTGFALFWMIGASQAGGFFWMFGLIHFTVGLSLLGTALFGNTLRRRWTWYTLTDKRAFIATDIPFKGRALKSYPINAETVIDHQQGHYSTIVFGHQRVPHKRGHGQVVIGFERLEDGDEVMRHIRNIQSQDA